MARKRTQTPHRALDHRGYEIGPGDPATGRFIAKRIAQTGRSMQAHSADYQELLWNGRWNRQNWKNAVARKKSLTDNRRPIDARINVRTRARAANQKPSSMSVREYEKHLAARPVRRVVRGIRRAATRLGRRIRRNFH